MTRTMKDSGIAWIGQIPEDWKLPKVKQLFSIGRGRVISQLDLEDTGYPVYSSQTKNNGCLGYISTYDFDRSQLTWTTDGVNAGTVFLREGKHNCTNVCGTLTPKNDENSLLYLKYALEYIAIYHKRADINGFKIMNNEMAEIKVTLPSMPEQQKIADFLDKKCSHIDSILEKTKASIDECKQLKQSVITQAVTKGIRPNRPMKDSGIEWIGQIPEDWEVRKLKTLTTIISKGTTPTTIGKDIINDGNIRFIKAENIQNDKLQAEPLSTIDNETNKLLKRSQLKQNDILFVIAGATIGKVAIVEQDFLPANTNQAVSFVRLFNTENHKFVWYFLKSNYIKESLNILAVQSAQPNLSMEDLGNFYLGYPDNLEQTEIVSYLDEKCTEIDKLITKKEKLIKELETYKKSLIYEYVTGKKEVI